MQSMNFEFLRPKWEALAVAGGFAERYLDSDPSSALTKLRIFCEQVVEIIYAHHALPKPPQSSLFDLLTQHPFEAAVPEQVRTTLHLLRKQGNPGAHGDHGDSRTARIVLKGAFNIGRWLWVTYGGGDRHALSEFREVDSSSFGPTRGDLKRERKALLQKLQAQESRFKELLAELEHERAAKTRVQATLEELEQTRAAGAAVASALDFDEAATRARLIDTMLAEAGWPVDSPDRVGREVEVLHQPTESGIGYADYVLRGEDERSLGVIEAKKAARDENSGRRQAENYADGLEKMTGQRPVIYYTNGYIVNVWNDAEDEPPRRIYGFHSADSLEYMIAQRHKKAKAADVIPSPGIAGRMYQIEALKRVIERFAAKHRRALIVQATGTGKTRVAISLCDALIKANWARRILFLCDRKELRKQADQAFQEFLGSEPRTIVTRSTYKDQENRIFLATYPSMMKYYPHFDIGFFDVIIADESHRSIYNRYRHLFQYFDAYQIGLTATPVASIHRNTYSLFGCEDQDPTAHYDFEDAVNDRFLVPFKVKILTYDFHRRGIKYDQLTEEQRQQLEDQDDNAEQTQYERHQVDNQIFNKDTNRRIIRNLMENGVRIKDGTQLGKTIVFARNHKHAKLLEGLFDEMYPQFGGRFCRVIDSHDQRADDLLTAFKDPERAPTIAISVDMLDTGIDIPEVVNLVFAKPVFSYVKFWQMIGRGTRLCPDLLGPGQDKTHFQIFDHWANFEYFDEKFKESDPSRQKSLLERLFEARIELAATSLDVQDGDTFDYALDLISRDIADLPPKSIAVRDEWKNVERLKSDGVLRSFTAGVQADLREKIAPLMQWRNIEGAQATHAFDLLIARLQGDLLAQNSRFANLRDDVIDRVSRLPMNLNPVRAREAAIQRAKSDGFWAAASVADLEQLRTDLRGIMKYARQDRTPRPDPRVIDVTEEESLIDERDYNPKIKGLDLAAYRNRVENALRALMRNNPTLARIALGEPVTSDDLAALTSLILTQDPDLDLELLKEFYPETADHLDLAIRSIIGLDAGAVAGRFAQFVQTHPHMNSTQIRFLRLLQDQIARNGCIELDDLYEAPFTTLNAAGIDGVFTDDATIDDILEIIDSFDPYRPADDGAES